MLVTIRDAEGSLPAPMREYAESRVQKLDRYFRSLRTAEVVHEQVRERHSIELTVEGDNVILRSEDQSSDMRVAIDNAIDKLEARLKRFKGKRFRSLARREQSAVRESARIAMTLEAVDDTAAEPVTNENGEFQIARIKHFPMRPISTEDAVLNMEMLGHDFHIFLDVDTENVHAVYRRNDGGYGLLIPELER